MTINTTEEHQAFDTHHNYIRCLRKLMSGQQLYYRRELRKIDLPNLDQKGNLITLTKKSLQDEYEIVKLDMEYSYASTSWLPVKSYYLIFNQLLTAEYAIYTTDNIWGFGHSKIVNIFTKHLLDNEIEFGSPLLNSVYGKEILDLCEVPGANLSTSIEIERTYKMVMRKIAEYKVEKWKHDNNINLRTMRGREDKERYLENFQVSIFDFLYEMRIRANYRDFAFINGVTQLDTAQYFMNFYLFALNFSNAIEGLTQTIVTMRNTS